MNRFFIIVLTLFSVNQVYGASLECPSICPALLAPTCGTNGKEFLQFDNKCLLNVYNCDRKRLALSKFTETDIDWCTTIDLDSEKTNIDANLDVDVDESCYNIPCPLIYKPVCGSNGTFRKTFSNECVMKSFDCLSKDKYLNNWRVLQRGNCSQHSQDE